jgi:hypothetical protein
MSDTSKSEPAVPASSTPAEPVTVTEPPAAEPPIVAPAAAEPALVGPPVLIEKKKRGVGAWSFVLGLLTALVDIGFVIFGIVALVGAISDLTSGDITGVTTALGAAGLAVIALFVFFGGFLSAGLAVLLGLIALISGRGRVLGVFGLLFGAGAIAVRLLLLSSGFSPDLG